MALLEQDIEGFKCNICGAGRVEKSEDLDEGGEEKKQR